MRSALGKRIYWVLVFGALLAAGSVGCGNKQEVQPTPAAQTTPGPQSTLGAPGTPTVQPKTIKIEAGDNPSWGPADAKVTIIEFSDFEGRYCGAFAVQTLPQIRANYGNKVRFVFMNAPLKKGYYAQKAAEAGECANAQGAFWPYHDLLFQNQQALTALLMPDVVESMKGYAAQLGLNTATFNDCLDSGKMAAAVQEDVLVSRKAVADAELTSFPVPSFFINGNYLSGAKTYDVFKQAIDAALAAAG